MAAINALKNLPYIGLIAFIVLADQISKHLILSDPTYKARACLDGTSACGGYDISGIFDLTMVWNRGMSFGLLQSEGIARWLLSALMVVIATGFFIWLLRAKGWLLLTSLALVVGGAIGNVIDRVRFGAVVDFLNFSGLGFPWVFNVADAAISVGAVLLFLDQFLLSEQNTAKDADT